MKKIFLATVCCSMSLLSFAQKKTDNYYLIDTHGDILYNQVKSGIDIGVLQKTGQFDLERAKQGGLKAQFFSVWSDQKGNFKVANQQIDSLNSLINRYPEKIKLIHTPSDLKEAIKKDQLAAFIGVEGGHMIDERIDYIDSLAQRGMAYLTLTWNNSTSWASSAAEETSGKVKAESAGLNEHGKAIIERLNNLGVIVDLSHVGVKTFFDAIQTTRKPVILSHSSVYAINPVPRNVNDEQIKAIKKNGGVICINLYSGFLDPNYAQKQKALIAAHEQEISEWTKIMGRGDAIDKLMLKYPQEAEALKPSLDLVVDHIDHIVKLIGIDHVGLGADFDGAESFPQGMDSVADYPKLIAALKARGYKPADIEKIAGTNVLRVWHANKK